ncbi:MAG: uracil-DNA glycosylase [Thermoplasmata archaeon]
MERRQEESLAPPHSNDRAQRRTDWDRLSEEIRSCQRCSLHKVRTQAVVYRGGLSPQVVFLGEAPGAKEDKAGLPFVGRAGQRLDEAIAHLGLLGSSFGVLNLIKCRPPNNRFDPAAAAACHPFLERQLDLLEPLLLVTLGASALASIDPLAPPVTKAAGHLREVNGRRVFPLVHPAATFRSRRYALRWESDLDRLREALPRLVREIL